MNKIFKILNLSFLSEYFLITAIFCLTFFCLFSINLSLNSDKFSIKLLRFNTQLIFLLIFILVCYLVLVYQLNIPFSNLTSFNDTILNDQLSTVSKSIIGLICIFYLMFTYRFIKNQKLNNFEYGTFLLASIFSFFLISFECESIQIYLSISLMGLAFYVLASFKKSSNFSVKSGIKHFAIGLFLTIMFLFAIGIYYGSLKETIFINFNKNPTNFVLLGYSTVCIFLNFLDSRTDILPLIENSESGKLKLLLEKLNECSKVLATSGKGSAGTAINTSNNPFDNISNRIEAELAQILNNINMSCEGAREILTEKLSNYEKNEIANSKRTEQWIKAMKSTHSNFLLEHQDKNPNRINGIFMAGQTLEIMETENNYEILLKTNVYDSLKSIFNELATTESEKWENSKELRETKLTIQEYKLKPIAVEFDTYKNNLKSN